MRIERRYTKEGQSPYAGIEFRLTTSEIRNPDGSIVFKADDVEVPAAWSQVAADVIAQKYFRKAGVPARLKKVEEETVPSWLWRSVPDEEALAGAAREGAHHRRAFVQAGVRAARRHLDLLGLEGQHFDSESDARAFFDELVYMLAMQMAAPNSPQWFNTGLHWAYGIDGPSQGHHYVDFETGKLTKSKSAYEHPQPHACFIQSIADDLVNEGGIMDLWVREARLFKYGSGTGSNFSSLRGEGERLAGGGKSSGLMSFLKIGDRAAGAIKSGGTTRRAAKMVIVDTDHPDIEQFIDWKVKEEQKVAVARHRLQDQPEAPARGPQGLRELRRLRATTASIPEKNPVLRREIKAARRNHVPDNYIKRVIQFAKQGYNDIDFPIYDTDWDSEAYLTVSGQNSNNTVRVTDEFLKAVEADAELGPDLAHQARQDRQDREGAAPVGEDRLRRLGLGRSRPAIPLHHQRLAHLPGVGSDHRVEPVLGIHVPRRHRLQSRLDEPARLPRQGPRPGRAAHLRRRRLRARRAAVDRGARDRGADGAVPLEADRAALLRVPHARPRLRQCRRPADVGRHPLRLATPAARSAAR